MNLTYSFMSLRQIQILWSARSCYPSGGSDGGVDDDSLVDVQTSVIEVVGVVTSALVLLLTLRESTPDQ